MVKQRRIEDIYLPGDSPGGKYTSDSDYACRTGMCSHPEEGMVCIGGGRRKRVETILWWDDEIMPS